MAVNYWYGQQLLISPVSHYDGTNNTGLRILRIELHDKHQVARVVQITDTHLDSSAAGGLLGMNTDESLNHVIDLVKRERGATDLLLATGDIANDASLKSYSRFNQMTASLAKHTLWLPGNHDIPEKMNQVVKGTEQAARLASIGNWQIIMLNSAVEGKIGGQFATSELDFLNNTLRSSESETDIEHVLVCLHHHPVSIGCDWLDEQKVVNSKEFFSVMDNYSHIRGVLWGHIHQTLDQQRNNVRLMATPSSCVQFAPNSRNFKLDRANPGYRWLELYPNGEIKTEVSRVTGVEFDLDYENSQGY